MTNRGPAGRGTPHFTPLNNDAMRKCFEEWLARTHERKTTGSPHDTFYRDPPHSGCLHITHIHQVPFGSQKDSPHSLACQLRSYQVSCASTNVPSWLSDNSNAKVGAGELDTRFYHHYLDTTLGTNAPSLFLDWVWNNYLNNTYASVATRYEC